MPQPKAAATDRKALAYMLASLGGKGVAALAQLCAISVFLRIHDADAAAVIFLLLGYATWFQLCELGLAQTAQNLFYRRWMGLRDLAAVVVGHQLLMLLAGAAVFFSGIAPALLLPANRALAGSDAVLAFSAGSALCVLNSTAVIAHRVLIVLHRGRLSNLLLLVQSLAIIASLLAYGAFGEVSLLHSVLAWALPQYLITLPLVMRLGCRLLRPGRRRIPVIRVFREAAGFFVTAALSSILLGLDTFMIARHLDGEGIVSYHVATRVFFLSFVAYYAYLVYAARRVTHADTAAAVAHVATIRRTANAIGFASVALMFLIALVLEESGLIALLTNGGRIGGGLLLASLVYYLKRVYCDTGLTLIGNLSQRHRLAIIYLVQIGVSLVLMPVLASRLNGAGIMAALTVAYLTGLIFHAQPGKPPPSPATAHD